MTGISMTYLPKKNELTVYMLEACSLRKTALSAGNDKMTPYNEDMTIKKHWKKRPPLLSYLSW